MLQHQMLRHCAFGRRGNCVWTSCIFAAVFPASVFVCSITHGAYAQTAEPVKPGGIVGPLRVALIARELDDDADCDEMLLRWDVEKPGQVKIMPTPMPTWDGVGYVSSTALPTFRTGGLKAAEDGLRDIVLSNLQDDRRQGGETATQDAEETASEDSAQERQSDGRRRDRDDHSGKGRSGER